MSLPKHIKPEPYRDIVVLVHYDDVPPVPAAGYMVTASDTDRTIFMSKLGRQWVDWDRIVAWQYLDDIWPGYTTEGLEDA